MSYGLFTRFPSRPGRRDELVAILLRAAAATEDNPACLSYVVGTAGEEDAVCVSEVWTDQSAHAASLDEEAARALIGQARDLIAGFPEQTRLTLHGGKGLPA
jgi:quinol monooxygenase YgiN